MARRLKTLAKEINKLHGYTAEIVEGYCNTDRKIPGTRLRSPGKGRYGNKLIVRNNKGDIILEHNAAETYRYNGEVERWLEDLLEEEKYEEHKWTYTGDKEWYCSKCGGIKTAHTINKKHCVRKKK